MQPLVEENTLGHQRIGTVRTEAGAEIADVVIAYQRWGGTAYRRLGNQQHHPRRTCLTGDSNAVAWWPGIIGPGKALDTDIYCVMCTNVIGGCSGSTGPSSIHPDGAAWGSRFPGISIRDQVSTEKQFLDSLGIDAITAVVGGSNGAGRAASNGRFSIPPLYDPHW